MALLIYGMKIMSEGLQKAADRQMRRAINTFTQTRFIGLVSGFLLTTILQSSTVVSVTLVGLVGVGIVPTLNSLAVIMGANIGTTVTGWLTILFNYQYAVHYFIMPLFIISVPLIIAGKPKLRFWGQFLMGFGLLLLGLDLIGKSTPNLEDLPTIFSFAESISEINIINICIYLLIGFVATLILQSSSATIVLTIILSGKGWIGYELAVAMIVGSNVGTTITAVLASLVSNYKAKTTALVHLGFNVFGTLWFIPFYSSFIAFNDFLITDLFGMTSVMIDSESEPFALALAHTSFNIINTILLIGFTPQIYQLTTKLVFKDKRKDIIKINLQNSPIQLIEFNVVETGKSVYKYAEIIGRLNSFSQNLLFALESDKIEFYNNKCFQYQEINDRIKKELEESTLELSQQELSQNSGKMVRALELSIENIASIAQIYFEIFDCINAKMKDRIWFSENQRQSIKNVYNDLDLIYRSSIYFIDETNQINYELLKINKERINEFLIMKSNLNPGKEIGEILSEGQQKSEIKYREILEKLNQIAKEIQSINDTYLMTYKKGELN